jgi:hypothetical protein
MPVLRAYWGGCHCGSVRFRVEGDLGDALLCNCSMCTKKGMIHLIVPRERFELQSASDSLTSYRFNTRLAEHLFCKRCGIHPFYVPRSHPDAIDVNVRCLDGIDCSGLSPEFFDGRSWERAMHGYRAARGT